MSRSLSRLRNLVSEIEQIQRQGQQGGKAALERSVNLKAVPEVPYHSPLMQEVKVEKESLAAVVTPEPLVEDPFLGLADVVDLEETRAPPAPAPKVEGPAGKVMIQLSGKIVLSLQVEHSDELVELQQLGNLIEIRFSDGKAFHLPLKSVV